MSASFLVDTNVLYYAVDPRAGPYALAAGAILDRAVTSGQLLISGQTMSEFYSASTRSRIDQPAICTAAQATQWIESWHQVGEFVPFTAAMSLEAVRGARAYQMNIYDAQLWALAKLSGLRVIVTEDEQSQPTIEGVRYINPFVRGFKLADLGL